MRYLCIIIIRIYRSIISPIKPACCRFYPTCSEYAMQAFAKHGFFAGLVLSVYRLARCNPFCRPGYDPVPERLTLRKAPFRKRGQGIKFQCFIKFNRKNIIREDKSGRVRLL